MYWIIAADSLGGLVAHAIQMPQPAIVAASSRTSAEGAGLTARLRGHGLMVHLKPPSFGMKIHRLPERGHVAPVSRHCLRPGAGDGVVSIGP
jgi:hypothetical protein